MQLSDKDKKQILEGFVDVFTRISNKEYQKRIWVKGEGPEVDDFDDTVCDFFGECDPILENYKDFGVTDKQYQLLIKFRDEFDAFRRGPALKYYSPQEFIDNPEWTKISEMAKEILKAFNYKKCTKSS
jgi:hypothetical protein